MVLHPLTEVIVRMLVSISVGSRQLMVHVLRDGKGSDRQEEQDQADRQTGPDNLRECLYSETSDH
jgi:hypothetical protein